jgi:hypothetical protein
MAHARREVRQEYAKPIADGLHRWLTSQRQNLAKADVTAMAIVMSLLESAKLNGHDPWAYLKDVLERLPTLKNRDLPTLLPHNWRPSGDAVVHAVTEKTDPAVQPVSSL